MLHTVPTAELRPTQATVGHREVMEKRREWAERAEGGKAERLGRHMVPVPLGPKARRYVVDHHLARALQEEGCERVLVDVVADLSMLDKEGFWVSADDRGWCHPCGADGRRAGFDAIPKNIAELADDPYRSLAGALRRAGGRAEETVPFAEFMWADALRRRVKRREVEGSFSAALVKAPEFARSRDARYLPGWCGPDDGS